MTTAEDNPIARSYDGPAADKPVDRDQRRKRERTDVVDDRARGKRLFDNLLGTLNAAKSAPRRVPGNVHDRAAGPDTAVSTQGGAAKNTGGDRGLDESRRDQAAQRARLETEQRRARDTKERELALANFLTTSGTDSAQGVKVPVLYYLPRQLTLEQEQTIQRQREAMRMKHDPT